MPLRPTRLATGICPATAILTAVLTLPALATSQSATQIVTNLGRQPANTPIHATVWLKLHNKAALDSAVQAMYTKGSPTYHHFASPSDLAQYAPTAAELQTVKSELEANHLTIVSVDKLNLNLKVTGPSSAFENAFHTTISLYQLPSGDIIKGFTATPAPRNGAANLVSALTGVAGRVTLQPASNVPTNPATGQQLGLRAAVSASPDGVYYSSTCFFPKTTQTLTSGYGSASITATYTGYVYGALLSGTNNGSLSPCAYGAADITNLLGLTNAYNQGYHGEEQTIAIVEAYGSPTITQDVAAFNQLESLPTAPLTITQTAPITATNSTWASQTTTAVEWAHAVAPAASILLVETPTSSDDDLQTGVLSIVENKSANVISNSYAAEEYYAMTYGYSQDITTWDNICEMAAYEGISANFPSGDKGDYIAAENITDVSYPADSPHATAVGGTSMAYAPGDPNTILTSGWGTNFTYLLFGGDVYNPPYVTGFQYGSGGGYSNFFSQPSWESAIGGYGRALPDISSLADPYTGVETVLTTGSQQSTVISGGTSLATALFSAEWAILNQVYSQSGYGSSLGQAAPLINEVSGSSALNDVQPISNSTYALTGSITQYGSTATYTASQLIDPEIYTGFFSAIYNASSGDYYDISFGTDSSLPIQPGWDQVTGWGTLNLPYIFDVVANYK